VYTENA
jgi:hypothetical protein